MLFWLEILVACVLLAILANAVVFYVLYRLAPERKWRARVEGRMADAEKRLRAERRELKDASVKLKKEETAIRRRAVDTFLKSLSVAELEAYPGIGPGTVSKLRSAGFSNLRTLQEASIRVHGLGAKRLADIENAVRALVKQARSRFEAGACREANDLGPELEAVRATHARREYLLRARLAGAEAVIAHLRPLLNKARKVTFFRYLRRKSAPAVPNELVHTPLPDLERTIQVAEDHALAAHASCNNSSVADRQTAASAAQLQPSPRPADWLSARPSSAAMRDLTPASAAAVPLASEELFQQALRSTTSSTQSLHAPPLAATQPREQLDLARLEVTIEFAFAVARADGRIAHKEKDIIERHIRTRFGNDLALLNRATAFCAYYGSAAIDLERCLQQIINLFTADERRALFDFASEIAYASGQPNQREVEFLEKVSGKLGILSAPQQAANAQKVAVIRSESANRLAEHSLPVPSSEQAQTMSSPAELPEAKPAIAATPEERLALLEIDPAVPLSADLVRRQFNLLSQRYAAERFESMGPEFVNVAENKRAALLAAATALLEQWGEKLETISPPGQPQELRHNPDLDAMLGA